MRRAETNNKSARSAVVLQTITARGSTAVARFSFSRPVALALEHGFIAAGATFFDYGCGRRDDVRRLKAIGFEAEGWDPVHRPDIRPQAADIVNFGYVANVIEDANERSEALRLAWALSEQVLIVAARSDWEERYVTGQVFNDGLLTRKGTFQKFYSQEELRDWIDQVLGVRSVAAAPGVFYVFRQESFAQRFIAARIRHRSSAPKRLATSESLYEHNRDLLDPLLEFIAARGRAPEPFELEAAAEAKARFGSLRAALTVLRHITGDEAWRTAQSAATDDLVVYLALAAFGGRPKVTSLPPDMQLDVKAFFGSYKNACAAADAVLFRAGDEAAIDRECRQARIGKLTREALYVHTTNIGSLSPLLRVYEGCARTLAGSVEGATLVKLHHDEPKVSYVVYPEFDTDPHPALAMSVRADLKRQTVRVIDFRQSANPPILHRKETFVAPDYPGRAKFARLTEREERFGLLTDPVAIGTRDKWNERVEQAGLRFHGHKLTRFQKSTPDQEHSVRTGAIPPLQSLP